MIQEQIDKIERQLKGNLIAENIKSALRKKLESLKQQINESEPERKYVKDEDVDTLTTEWTKSYVNGELREKKYFSFNKNQMDYYQEIKQYGIVGYEGEKNGIYYYVLEVGNGINKQKVDELYKSMIEKESINESYPTKEEIQNDYQAEVKRQKEQGIIDDDTEGISVLGLTKGKDNPVDKIKKQEFKKGELVTHGQGYLRAGEKAVFIKYIDNETAEIYWALDPTKTPSVELISYF